MARSIEETVEYWAKQQLDSHGVGFFTKTDRMNSRIMEAMRQAPSKSGGIGENFPDIKCMVRWAGRDVPVMIEVKGTKGRLVKLDKSGHVANETAKGTPAFANISGYAVNGAVHYSKAILDYAGDEYRSVIAVGVNGYEQDGETVYEVQSWYLSAANMGMPKRFANDTLSWLWDERELARLIEDCVLTADEKAALERSVEDRMDANLRELNQYMYNGTNETDKRGRYGLNLSVSARVPLVCGMIMAGLGVLERGVEPLSKSELKGASGKQCDGRRLLDAITDFLDAKNLPSDKRKLVVRILEPTFMNASMNERRIGGFTPLHELYAAVSKDVTPFVDPERTGYLDFTGKLFNVLYEWVDIPDGGENDVVLTPRYVCEMMARICEVGRDDYVWDYALGTASFLVTSMKLMLEDATENIQDVDARREKCFSIRANQLLGIEKREDIYMLAVLNMVLMGDGSANVICGDSMAYDGTYQQGVKAGERFPATVFLLNPPYSAPGKGFNFVEKALGRMSVGGRAAILIQENAGSGAGLPYTERILKRHSLKAVIHMADIFKGKSSVRTAVYVFDVGKPHDVRREVTFIDMDEDGYVRQNRKKASSATNLRDADHARERYVEVVDIVLGHRKSTDFYKDGEQVFRDCISLSGDDWTVNQHRKYDTTPTEDDFKAVVSEYLAWKVGAILKGEMTLEEACGGEVA